MANSFRRNGTGIASFKQWVDQVREDLQIAGLSYTQWRKFQARAVWRAATHLIYGLESV